MQKKTYQMALLMLSLSPSIILTGCGGGSSGASASQSSSTVISGTAAGGAPIIGTVWVKDSSTTPQQKSVQINSDGSYSIDVSGMTAPYVLKASGMVGTNSITVTSLATHNDLGQTVNITPLTDLVTASVTKQDGASFYNSFGSASAAAVTPSNIQTANQNLTKTLNPLLQQTAPTVVDVIHTPFTANHKGYDFILDLLKVTKDPTTNTEIIQNKLDGGSGVNLDLTNGTYNTTITANNNPGTTQTSLQAIQSELDSFSALFSAGLPASTTTLLPYFVQDGTFVFNGSDLTAFLKKLTTSSEFSGIKFSNISINTINPDGSILLNVAAVEKSGDVFPIQLLAEKNPDSGAAIQWLFAGNQRKVDMDVTPKSVYSYSSNSVTDTLGLYVKSSDLAKLPFTTSYVLVTGAGLPTQGVKLFPASSTDISNGRDWMPIETSMSVVKAGGNQLYQSDCINFYATGANDCHINDGQIPANSQYTFAFYDNNGVKQYAASVTLTAAPMAEADALKQGTSLFPAITSHKVTPTSVYATWSLPAGMFADSYWAFTYNNLTTPSFSQFFSGTLAPNQTLFQQALSGMPSTFSGNGELIVHDIYHREFALAFSGTVN